MNRIIAATLLVATLSFSAFAQMKKSNNQADKDIVSTREMERINWMEFKETD